MTAGPSLSNNIGLCPTQNTDQTWFVWLGSHQLPKSASPREKLLLQEQTVHAKTGAHRSALIRNSRNTRITKIGRYPEVQQRSVKYTTTRAWRLNAYFCSFRTIIKVKFDSVVGWPKLPSALVEEAHHSQPTIQRTCLHYINDTSRNREESGLLSWNQMNRMKTTHAKLLSLVSRRFHSINPLGM